jgi:hypothetical protein
LKYQCLLEEKNGTRTTVAWIDERACIKGAAVEIVDEFRGGWYIVRQVYYPPLDAKQLAKKQSYDRKGFPSLDKDA